MARHRPIPKAKTTAKPAKLCKGKRGCRKSDPANEMERRSDDRLVARAV